MPVASQMMTDPLHAFTAGAFVAGTPRPCPLIATSFEATITFPLPVHATLFALEARVGERVLSARAAGREAARRTYEDALDRGKAAVLHEEVLRGVHMLSIGQL